MEVRRWVEGSGTGAISEGIEGECLACSGEAHYGEGDWERDSLNFARGISIFICSFFSNSQNQIA